MSTQLEALIAANGPVIEVRGRTFTVEGVSGDGDIALATFKAKKASYTGIRYNNARVAGVPDAEVWSILGGKREIASFAVHDGKIKALVG